MRFFFFLIVVSINEFTCKPIVRFASIIHETSWILLQKLTCTLKNPMAFLSFIFFFFFFFSNFKMSCFVNYCSEILHKSLIEFKFQKLSIVGPRGVGKYPLNLGYVQSAHLDFLCTFTFQIKYTLYLSVITFHLPSIDHIIFQMRYNQPNQK